MKRAMIIVIITVGMLSLIIGSLGFISVYDRNAPIDQTLEETLDRCSRLQTCVVYTNPDPGFGREEMPPVAKNMDKFEAMGFTLEKVDRATGSPYVFYVFRRNR